MIAPDHATKPFETILRERGIHTWHLDEVFEVLETVVTAKRDKVAALKFLKRIMKKYGQPRSVVTDGLCSYPAAMKEIGNADRHEVGRRLNNCPGNPHQPFRRRERAMQRFRSAKHCRNSAQFMLRSTTISTRNVISSPAKSTNRDARLRRPNGAQSRPDPHLEFLSRQTHTVVVHRSRFCLARPSDRRVSGDMAQGHVERQFERLRRSRGLGQQKTALQRPITAMARLSGSVAASSSPLVTMASKAATKCDCQV